MDVQRIARLQLDVLHFQHGIVAQDDVGIAQHVQGCLAHMAAHDVPLIVVQTEPLVVAAKGSVVLTGVYLLNDALGCFVPRPVDVGNALRPSPLCYRQQGDQKK